MSSKNELISITRQNNEFKISTTKGILIIQEDDAEAIKLGNFPSGVKNSPYIEGISLKTIRHEILRALNGTKKTEDGKNQATVLWELIEKSNFFQDQMGFSYTIRDNIPMSVESVAFQDYLAYLFYNTQGIVPSTDSINLVQKMCRAKASQNILNVGVRTHKVGNDLIYDPINEDGSVIVISKDGIAKVIPKQPYTIRYNGMLKAEIQDGEPADLKTLLKLWNLDEDQEVLISGIIGTNFISDIPHTINIITGPHGAGKSSLSDALKTIPDPNIVTRNSLKFDEREIAVSSLHEGVLNFDNVNTIIPDYISDLLCRISTGQGFKKRKLYTDQDDLILRYRRPIVINAINEPGYAPDFLDRALVIRLELISKSERRTDSEIQSIIESYAPKIRGLYLNILSKAIMIYPQIEEEYRGKLLRMADVIIWGEAITRSLGYESDKFYKAFNAVQLNETEVSASENVLIMAIEKLLERNNEWKGSTQALYDEFKGIMAEMGIEERDPLYKQLPKNYRELGRRLTTFIPTLLNLGIKIEENRNGKERTKIIRKLNPDEIPKQGDNPQKENKEDDNPKAKEEKNLDSFSNRNDVINVTNVTEPEKSKLSTGDITDDVNNGGVTNSKVNDLTSNEREEGTQKKGDTMNNNVTGNVTSQKPEKSESRDISDINDVPPMSKENEKNNFSEEEGVNYGTDYYKILIPFQYEFETNGKTVKVNCKEGEIRKLTNKNAILHRAYVEKACPNGHYDPNSRECIADMGGNNNE